MASIQFNDDTVYYPNWLQNLGYDADQIAAQIEAIGVADRSAAHMKYRGHELKRSKFFFVDSLEQVPVYTYPGFQYATIVKEYQAFQACPLIWALQQLIFKQTGHECNHIIGTTYYDENDNIGWHNDKIETLDVTMPIYTLSFLQQRPLALRPNPTDTNSNPKVVAEMPMGHGSLNILGPKTNQTHQHAILPSKDPLKKRISVIFRVVKKRLPMAEIRKKAAVTEKRRGDAV